MAEHDASSSATPTIDPDVFEEWSRYVARYASDEEFIKAQVEQLVVVTTFDRVVGMVSDMYNWSRRSSLWPLQFGLACCAIEMISTAASRFDIARFGAELFRPSPRQADLMIVSGTVTKKMAPQVVRLFNQMPEPRYVLSMGACATGGGPFKEGYSVVSGIDKFIPVDVYVPGCPPTPQALLHGLITLQRRIDGQSLGDVSWYRRGPVEEYPVPVLGADLIDLRKLPALRERAAEGGDHAAGGAPEVPAQDPGLLGDPEIRERLRVWRERAAARDA